jgi:hypothetical protein
LRYPALRYTLQNSVYLADDIIQMVAKNTIADLENQDEPIKL